MLVCSTLDLLLLTHICSTLKSHTLTKNIFYINDSNVIALAVLRTNKQLFFFLLLTQLLICNFAIFQFICRSAVGA